MQEKEGKAPASAYASLGPGEKRARLLEISLSFLKLGLVAFGGPAAHIALMEEEMVSRRGWISRESFLDMLGATNLLPGPNSTEMALHLGLHRGGPLGLLLAGLCFLLPAVVLTLALAMLYQGQGQLAQVAGALQGIKPVVLAMILRALYRLGRTLLKGWLPAAVAVAALILYLLGLPEIPLLLLAGLFVMLIRNRALLFEKLGHRGMAFLPLPAALAQAEPAARAAQALSLGGLFLSFLKIGSFLYGSGYVLLAFLESEFVTLRGLISHQQLLDAVVVGQLTPGPVFTAATFVGYLIAGIPGGLTATAGIFLPAFVLVYALNPLIPRMRASRWLGPVLDGVNAASLALMAAVLIRLVPDALTGWLPIAGCALAFLALARTRISPFWLIAAGGAVGLAAQQLF